MMRVRARSLARWRLNKLQNRTVAEERQSTARSVIVPRAANARAERVQVGRDNVG